MSRPINITVLLATVSALTITKSTNPIDIAKVPLPFHHHRSGIGVFDQYICGHVDELQYETQRCIPLRIL